MRSVNTLAAVMMGLASQIASPASAQQPGAPPPPVTVSEPIAKRITQWDEYWGRFQAVERVEVRPRVSGFIESYNFKDGTVVEAGDLLFKIDRRPFQNAVDVAKAEVARTKAQVEVARTDVERAEPLAKTRVLSDRELDQRKANLGVAQAQQQSAEASLKTAELNLEWTDVRAPISGRISDRKVDAGNLVSGGQDGATLLATIVKLQPIHFLFEVSEADYLRYARLFLSGQRPSSRDAANPVRIKLADEAEFVHKGTMDFVDNALNERSATMRGRALLDNANQLLAPGMFGRLQLFGGDIDALLIPDASVVSDQARKIVFTVDEKNTIVAKPVTLGPLADGLRVVKDGLKATDKVVIEGIANPAVRPGAPVTPSPGKITAVATTN